MGWRVPLGFRPRVLADMFRSSAGESYSSHVAQGKSNLLPKKSAGKRFRESVRIIS